MWQKRTQKGGGCPRVFYFFDAIFPVLVFLISPSVPTLQTPAQVLSGNWRTEILTLCTVGFHNSYFGKTSLESARLKSQYQIISDFTQNRRQQQILSKTHKYFLFDFFATNADYFSLSQTQTKEISFVGIIFAENQVNLLKQQFWLWKWIIRKQLPLHSKMLNSSDYYRRKTQYVTSNIDIVCHRIRHQRCM